MRRFHRLAFSLCGVLLAALIFLALWSIPWFIEPLMALGLWLFPQWIANAVIMGSGMYVQHAQKVEIEGGAHYHSNTFLSRFFNLPWMPF